MAQSKRNIKFGAIVTLGTVYFLSFWLLTIGYFTPNWVLVDISSGNFDTDWPNYWNGQPPWNGTDRGCNSVGLFYPTKNCDVEIYNWFKTYNIHSITRILQKAFILMTTAMVVLYTNAAMLVAAVVFDLFHYSLYISMVSISFGVFYFFAAFLVLVATIYVEAAYNSDSGYSAMLCTAGGCLMLFFYISLIVYDRMYIKSMTSRSNGKKPKHITGRQSTKTPDIPQQDNGGFEIHLKRRYSQPVRHWGLRRT